MNKKLLTLIKKINDFPILEFIGLIFILFFLTIVVVNVMMNGKLIDPKFLEDVLSNVIKGM